MIYAFEEIVVLRPLSSPARCHIVRQTEGVGRVQCWGGCFPGVACIMGAHVFLLPRRLMRTGHVSAQSTSFEAELFFCGCSKPFGCGIWTHSSPFGGRCFEP